MESNKVLVLKNRSYISTYAPSDCPPKEARPVEIEAYRCVNNPIVATDFDSYIKLGKLPRQTEKSHTKCKCCGLSMFISIESVKIKYNNLPNKSNFEYTHIAKGILSKSDGVMHPIETKGHFTFHEYEGVDLAKKFNVIDSLT